LQSDAALRRIRGWEAAAQVPRDAPAIQRAREALKAMLKK